MPSEPTMAAIIEGLRESYKDEGVVLWLTARHRLLNGQRPVDLLDDRAGRLAVYQQVRALLDGAFV